MKAHRLIILVLLALGGIVGWCLLPLVRVATGSATKGADGTKAVPVTVIAVVTREVPIWLAGLGTVQAYNRVTIRPRVSGVLDEIRFTEGQMVKEGDVLARIDPRPYASLLAQAQAKEAQSSAQLGNARLILDRVTELVKRGADSRQNFDQLAANVAQFTAQEQADAAAASAAQLNLDFTTLKAPITGRTGVRLIDKGNLVTASQDAGVVVISQFQPISVVFTLPQSNLPAVRKRMLETPDLLTVQALKDDGQILATGKLELVDNQIDTNSGTLPLKATFPNTDQALWPGQFLTARVLVETRKQAIVVPTEVIKAGLDGLFVYIVKPDLTVEVRKVSPGPRVDDITVIEEGLTTGEVVVLDGQSKLQPGADIIIQPDNP
jgi:multidrug efflux system membrane fusion protein